MAGTLQSDVPVIDADDLTVDPEGIVEAFCAAVGIPFVQTAMTWEPGLVDQWTRWHDWYEGVADSTGFKRRDASGEPRPPVRTTSRVAALLTEVTGVYERIAATKLVAKSARR